MYKKAVLLMILSALCFAGMGAAVKAAGDLPVVQKVFFRNLVILFVVSFLLRGQGLQGYVARPGNRRALIFRSTLGLTAVFFYYYALGRMVLADAAMINKLNPFFVTLFAAIFLKERVSLRQVGAMILGFAGALLVIKPHFDLTMIPALAALGSAVLAAGAYTLVKHITGTEHPNTVIFWFSAFSVAVTLGPVILFWQNPSPGQAAALGLTGLFAAGGQYCVTHAYKYGPAGEISVYGYLMILFSGTFGFFLWGEVPDAASLAGGCLIIGSALWLALGRRRISTES